METWVIVDDTDLSINYKGPWAWTSSSINAIGATVGFDNTAHAVLSPDVNETSPASFTYTFEGTKLAIHGISATFNRTLQVPGPSLPKWECIIDNKLVLSNEDPFGVFPPQSYCETDALSAGKHTVEFRVTDTGIGLWFDSLRFLPSPQDTSQTNVTVWIDSTDTRLRYRDDWQAIGTGYMTTKESLLPLMTTPAFSMNYNGSSVAWYALSKAAIEKARPDLRALTMGNTTTSHAFYRIDNGPAAPFVVDLSPQPVTPDLNPYNTLLFATRPTIPGPHTLDVFYDGNSTVWPLTLDYLTIENSLIGATASGSAPGSSGAKATSQTTVIGGAVGGIVGGLLVLFIGLLMLRKRRRRQQKRYNQTRALQLANSDIKLRPFSRMVEPVEEKPTQEPGQYPFSPNNGRGSTQA
ncbi:hypothetical protein D9619_011582 [Psilocybe cf. subviscida]|uniref:Uncharacterized protein n=1 Tax=Psilocybe cf. subviscida TaxID=2480587 RepID=A0A8H5BSZ3_9AGAR|nr:hypothetical protein D9619_011582 [Psilocybe cf. subviscida]